MRILVFTTLYPNDVETGKGMFIRHRVQALSRAGAKIKVVAPVPYFPFKKGFGRWSRMARIAYQRMDDKVEVFHPRTLFTPKLGMRFYGRWMKWCCQPTVERILKTHPIDLIDAHFIYPDGYAAYHMAKDLDLKMVVTARGTDAHTYPSMGFLRGRLQRVLQGAKRVFAVSRSLASDLDCILPVGRAVVVTPNGVDTVLFRPLSRTAARSRLHLQQAGKILVGIGRLVPIKSWDLAISALAHLRDLGGGDLPSLYLIGDGELRKRLERKIVDLGLVDHVFLVGERSQVELPYWLSAADALIHPSQREGWPNVVLEALACGTPVVGRDIASIREVAPSPETSILKTPLTGETLAQGVREVLARGYDRKALLAHAHNYSWEQVATNILGELKRIHEYPVSP